MANPESEVIDPAKHTPDELIALTSMSRASAENMIRVARGHWSPDLIEIDSDTGKSKPSAFIPFT